MAGDRNIYLYGCASLSASVFAVLLGVYMCVIQNQSTSEKPYPTSVNLAPCYQRSTCVDP